MKRELKKIEDYYEIIELVKTVKLDCRDAMLDSPDVSMTKLSEPELMQLSSKYTYYAGVCLEVWDSLSMTKSNLKYNPLFTGVFEHKAKEYDLLERYLKYFNSLHRYFEHLNDTVKDAMSYQRHLRYNEGM